MHRLFAVAILTVALLAPAVTRAHDPKLHKGNLISGEIVSVAGDSFELKTKTGNLKVSFNSKTKFEHGSAAADPSHLKNGEPAGVIGTKLPTGELVAKEVVLGVKPAAAKSKEGIKK